LDDGKELHVHNKQLYFPFGRKHSKAQDLVVSDLGNNDKEMNRFPGCDVSHHDGQAAAYRDSDQISKVSEEFSTFQWGDDGELNADGICEHRRLEMMVNGEKIIIEVGDTVSLNGPEGSSTSFIAKIERMWQASTTVLESGMNIRTQWYFTVRSN
jgi:hypothetical protein